MRLIGGERMDLRWTIKIGLESKILRDFNGLKEDFGQDQKDYN